MKKIFLLSLFLGLAGSVYALEKIDITTGVYMESENHNATYKDSDVTVHGIRLNLNAKDYPIWTEFVYEYRNANSLSGHQGDADRYKFMLGSYFSLGDFYFKPTYELRITDVRESSLKTTDHRFQPNWDYKFNDQWSLFNGWLFGLRVDKDYRGYSETKSWDDYFHELETGVKYKFASDQNVSFSLYNEYVKNEKSDRQFRAYKFEDWQLRIAYQKMFDNGISISPFMRYSVSSKSKYADGIDGDHNGTARYGVKIGYAADNGIGVSGETYFQDKPEKRNIGSDKAHKDRFFFKLGLDYKF